MEAFAGPLFFAVSTFKLYESIRDAAEKLVVEKFPLMPSYVGITAVSDDLKITCDPHATLPVAKTVQRKMVEAGRGLNFSKCRSSGLCGVFCGLAFGPEVPYVPAPLMV